MTANLSWLIQPTGIAACLILMAGANTAMAIEKPKYETIESFSDIEIRRYEPMTVARTLVRGEFRSVGNTAFRRLADYIFGGNREEQKISMTAPVTQYKADDDAYWITFMMPSEYDLDRLPAPNDERVELSRVAEQTFAVIRYRGGWSEKSYRKHEAKLLEQLAELEGWEITGQPMWARYDPPLMPSWFRTNEILVPVRQR